MASVGFRGALSGAGGAGEGGGAGGGGGGGVWRFSANAAYGSFETPQLMNRDQPADVPVEQLAAL